MCMSMSMCTIVNFHQNIYILILQSVPYYYNMPMFGDPYLRSLTIDLCTVEVHSVIEPISRPENIHQPTE